MRLFIAIRFSNEIKDELKRFQKDLKQNGLSGRFVPLENLHLTLAFIGEYSDPDEILDVMESVPFTPFDIELEGVGNFGDLFWAGLRENKGLDAYVRRLRRALSEAGIPFDRIKFSPHITLIRRAEMKAEAVARTEPPTGKMHADTVSLMRSDRGKSGMIYTEIGSVTASIFP